MAEETMEAEDNFELDEISEKEYEAEIDAEISIAANSMMEEMILHEVPVIALVEETIEEEREELMEEEAIVEVTELSPEVVLFELAPEKILNPSDFILNKPTNIYATEEEIEEALEEEVIFEEAPMEELEEEMEEEEMVEEEEMELSFSTNSPVVEMVEEQEMETPAAPEVEYQSSFSMQEEPTMQLVMREETSPEPARPVHPSSLEMPLDNAEEQRRKVAERIQKLRNLSFNINNGPDPNTEFDAIWICLAIPWLL
jgi:cell division protein FtsZ